MLLLALNLNNINLLIMYHKIIEHYKVKWYVSSNMGLDGEMLINILDLPKLWLTQIPSMSTCRRK